MNTPRLSVVVVGCGPRGFEHAQAVKTTAELRLVGVTDLQAERRDHAARECEAPAFDDVTRMLEATRPEVVVLVTTATQRASLCSQALSVGSVRAIVLEKPMAASLDEAIDMVNACERAGVQLVVSHQLRFCPEFIALRQAVESGAIGPINLLQSACFGNMLVQGPHVLDMICSLAGAARPRWVVSGACSDVATLTRLATAGTPPFADAAHPAPAWQGSIIGFDGGLRAVVETGVLYPRSRQFMDDWLQKRVMAIGAEGFAEAQAASHFRIASNGQPRTESSSFENYLAATPAFYAELVQTLNDARPHRCNAREALASFELVHACMQSAESGALVSLPLAAASKARPSASVTPSGARASAAPDVSVIIVLNDHRGHAPDCLKAWHKQTLPRYRYEIVIVSDGREPEVEHSVRALLQVGDQLLRCDADSELALYHHGAQAARGQWLLFTEPHCEAEDICLAQMLEYLESNNVDGACLRSRGANGNRFAAMEDRLYEDGFVSWSKPDAWQKVILRGFAIRRSTYFEDGGFEHRFRRFAEWAFAATLHHAGRRLGYAAGAAVVHHNTMSVREVFDPVWDFTQGECAYRDAREAANDAAWCDRYFGRPPQWIMRQTWNRGEASVQVRAAIQCLLHDALPGRQLRWATSLVRTIVQRTPAAMFGLQWPFAGARLRWLAARVRYLLTPGRRWAYPAYVNLWKSLVNYATTSYLASHPDGARAPGSTAATRELATIDDRDLVDVHAPESWNESRFRWTSAASSIRLHLPKADGFLSLDILPVRTDSASFPLSIWFNGRRIPRTSMERTAERIRIRIAAADFAPENPQRLTLVCWPWPVADDQRRLGIPLHRVTFETSPAQNEHALRHDSMVEAKPVAAVLEAVGSRGE